MPLAYRFCHRTTLGSAFSSPNFLRGPPRASSRPIQLDMDPVATFQTLTQDESMAIQVAVIEALAVAVQHSSAQTMMELERELKDIVEKLKQVSPNMHYSVSAGSEIFVRAITRPKIDFKEIDELKRWVVSTAKSVSDKAQGSRKKIAKLFDRFVVEGMTILTYSHSRVVMECLLHASQEGKRFSVLTTESRGQSSSIETTRLLSNAGLPVKMILDNAVAFHMKNVDAVLIGAEAIAESGGAIAKPGPFQLAILAREFNIPVYIAVESYKFSRTYPLTQDDLPNPTSLASADNAPEDCAGILNAGVRLSLPRWEYTPPEFITLLVTDLGILTPSAVSDELIKLYLN